MIIIHEGMHPKAVQIPETVALWLNGLANRANEQIPAEDAIGPAEMALFVLQRAQKEDLIEIREQVCQ